MLKTALFTALVACATTASAQETTIEGVISSQLNAFNNRDLAQAWDHASPMIQGMFRTPENFANMVEQGYPMVWDNSDVQFLERDVLDSVTYQEVMITGPEGGRFIIDYQMVETPDGWHINGVQVIPAPEVFS